MAAALGVREEPQRPLAATLLDALQAKKLLLVLDNCEHLIDSCAQLAQTLLSTCPQLRILATSREALNLAGETSWLVPSLAVPNPKHLPPLAEMAQVDAVRLFVERAVAALPTFTLTEANAAAVAHLCQRLDGLPLAIELAAARIKVLAIEQLVARLDDCFRLLTAGSRTALPRHQTLRAAIEWSHDLLSKAERTLLRRLAVFAGGWILEAAEAICMDGEIAAGEVLELLAHLVDKSLVLVDLQPRDETRYRLRETVRQYGHEKLREAGEAVAIEGRHAAYYLALAEQAEPELRGPQQQLWLDRLEQEHNNLRAALAWSQTQAVHAQTGLRLAAALWRFWFLRGYWSEGRGWLEAALAQTQTAGRTKARATAVVGAGMLAAMCTDYVGACALLEEGLMLGQETDKASMGFSMTLLGIIGFIQGDGAAHSRLEASVAILRETDDHWALAWALHLSGDVASGTGDYEAARVRYEESLTLRRAIGDKLGMVHTLGQLGLVFYRQGDYARAARVCEQSVTLGRESGYEVGLAYVLLFLGRALRHEGNYSRARALLGESLTLGRELGDNRAMAWCLDAWADLACAEDQTTTADRAARLFGAAEVLREAIGISTDLFDRAEYERDLATARGRLDEAAFATAWAEGRAMTLEQAIAYTLEGM